LAACLAILAAWTTIHFAYSRNPASPQSTSARQLAPQPSATGVPETTSAQALIQSQQAIANLDQQVDALKDKLRQTTAALKTTQKQLVTQEANLKEISQERDTLRGQLSAAQDDAGSLREKVASQATSETQQGTRVAALETQVQRLNASLEDTRQELNEKTQLLSLDKEFLDHDRDIRDVIGARNLYIADITDINPNGKQARQFGRIFYTKDKSLLFYGFDLDSQAGHKKDVSYQVWGSSADRSSPVSLGLFFQDNAHKRWVLRCNDARTLARLNMVFVTVEPPGGSARPTGKQLLRTYLQIHPNHP
jgi:septal ring factor EnvC (AmiA/AmiB activator)